MSPNGTITADRLWKRFRPDFKRRRLSDEIQRIRERAGGTKVPWMWALQDVCFEVNPGESLGLVGANGSGKSTLLKILNRVMYPYVGSVEAVGRVGALIEVAAGIHPELTGRENIFLYGSLMGLPRRDVATRFDGIVEFAELDRAVDRQVKFYSSGMKMRLGFAVSAFLEPDILLVDEVLAVGDATFQQRCLNHMRKVLAEGTTLVYVSHDLPTVEATCARAVWLEHGVIRDDGNAREVLNAYRRAVEAHEELILRTDGLVRVLEATVSGEGGALSQTSAPLHARLVIEAETNTRGRLFLGITEGPGTPIVTVAHDLLIDEGKTTVECRIDHLPLARGRYFLWSGIFRKHADGRDTLPWGPVAHFDVAGPELDEAPRGIVRLAPIYTNADWDVSHPGD